LHADSVNALQAIWDLVKARSSVGEKKKKKNQTGCRETKIWCTYVPTNKQLAGMELACFMHVHVFHMA